MCTQKNESLLSLDELLHATGGALFGADGGKGAGGKGACVFTSVSTDSRTAEKGALFAALKGTSCDGHSFIEKACENGATVVLAMNSSVQEFSPLYEALAKRGVSVVLTENTLHALQKAAAFYVAKFPALQKIGITGSSGKTTVKECVASILCQSYSVVMNRGNLNSETGLPLSVFNIRPHHQIGVFEMGMNRTGEIKELADVLVPQTALITNIGTAHIGILGSTDNIAEEKKRIFSNFTAECTGFVPEDDPYKEFLMRGVPGTMHTFGLGKKSPVTKVEDAGLKGSRLFYKNLQIDFPLCGIHNAKNAAAAIAVAEHFGIAVQNIKAGLESVKPLSGRMQILEGDITIVKDCYNANPDSMGAAIDFLNSVRHPARKVLVLGDMFELGKSEGNAHARLVNKALGSDAEFIVFAGKAFNKAFAEQKYAGGKKIMLIPDAESVETCAPSLRAELRPGDLVLIKASFGMALGRLVPFLTDGREGAA